MATGMARGAKERGRRIAFGDGRRIIWDQNSEVVFRRNPNIAAPGSEGGSDVDWMGYYKGNRIYNKLSADGTRWIWNYDFKAKPGEVYFDLAERLGGKKHGTGFVLFEPNIEMWKGCAPNKLWGFRRYQAVADRLKTEGHEIKQFAYGKGGPLLKGANLLPTQTFRDALTMMAHAAIYIGPEGGLHHAAAALGIKAVVLFGGFVPPAVTGYDNHVNLTGGADEACGSLTRCAHCRAAMDAIEVEQVAGAAMQCLGEVV